MTRVIRSEDIPRLLARTGTEGLSKEGTLWAYCCLDSMVTHEVDEDISQPKDPETELIYDFERAQQAPALAMMLRGVKVDKVEMHALRAQYALTLQRVLDVLNKYAHAIWGKDLNPFSPQQVQELLYEKMYVPPVTIRFKGESKVGVIT